MYTVECPSGPGSVLSSTHGHIFACWVNNYSPKHLFQMQCEDLETKLEEIVLVVGFATIRPECVSASPATAAHFATDRYIHTYISSCTLFHSSLVLLTSTRGCVRFTYLQTSFEWVSEWVSEWGNEWIQQEDSTRHLFYISLLFFLFSSFYFQLLN